MALTPYVEPCGPGTPEGCPTGRGITVRTAVESTQHKINLVQNSLVRVVVHRAVQPEGLLCPRRALPLHPG